MIFFPNLWLFFRGCHCCGSIFLNLIRFCIYLCIRGTIPISLVWDAMKSSQLELISSIWPNDQVLEVSWRIQSWFGRQHFSTPSAHYIPLRICAFIYSSCHCLCMYVCRMYALIALVCWVLRLLCYGWLASFSNRYKDSRCQRIGTLTKLPSTCTQKHCGRRTFTLSNLFYVYHCYKEMVVNCSWSYIKRGCWRYLHPVPSTIR